jgi:hypothetical protein
LDSKIQDRASNEDSLRAVAPFQAPLAAVQACQSRTGTIRRSARPCDLLIRRESGIIGFEIAFQAPAVDDVTAETPVAADSESRQGAAAQEFVGGRRVNPQIGGEFLEVIISDGLSIASAIGNNPNSPPVSYIEQVGVPNSKRRMNEIGSYRDNLSTKTISVKKSFFRHARVSSNVNLEARNKKSYLAAVQITVNFSSVASK